MGTCDPCGGKAIHLSRKVARQAARDTYGGSHRPRPYRCPHNPEHWHTGHVPDALRQGEIDRDRYRSTVERRDRDGR